MDHKRIAGFFNRIMAMTGIVLAAGAMCSCSDDDDFYTPPVTEHDPHGTFVVCEGNYGSSNSSLTWMSEAENVYLNEVFRKANDVPLGSQAQSMTIHNDEGWIVVSDSHIIFRIDLGTYIEKGRITGLTKPRYIHFISDTKAYVSLMNSSRIAIVNPATCTITGYIDLPDMYGSGDGAMMVQEGKYVYVNCWSYQNKIVRIDTTTDRADASLTVGVQPKEMVMDKNRDIWVVCDGGGWDQNPAGYETPTLVKIDTGSFSVAKRFNLTLGANVGSLAINGTGDRLYWTNNDIYSMDITSGQLPERPLIEAFPDNPYRFYGIGVNPKTGMIYVADAKDFTQNGQVLIYTTSGEVIRSFDTGIAPRFFCFYE